MSIYRDGELACSAAETAREAAREAKRRLLGSVRIASPCKVPWSSMDGDDRVRHCLVCEKNVYNLSAMNQAAAEDFIEEAVQSGACIRFFQRADGTILTADCPVGVAKKRRRLKIVGAVAGVGAVMMEGVSMLSESMGSASDPGVQGKINAPIGAAPETAGASQAIYK